MVRWMRRLYKIVPLKASLLLIGNYRGCVVTMKVSVRTDASKAGDIIPLDNAVENIAKGGIPHYIYRINLG